MEKNVKVLDLLKMRNNIRQIKYHGELILRDAEVLTPGNLAHHRAAMASYARYIIGKCEAGEASIDNLLNINA